MNPPWPLPLLELELRVKETDELFEACREWQRLVEAEGDGIRHGNWDFVRECQAALRQLQPKIAILGERSRRDWHGEARHSAGERKGLHSILVELLELQRRNQRWLDDRRRRLLATKEDLQSAGRNLRRIQRSYSQSTEPGWSSFS